MKILSVGFVAVLLLSQGEACMKSWTGLTSSEWNGMDLGRNITVDNQNGHAVDRISTTVGITESCLDCGTECLSAVQSAVPVCIAAGFEYTQALFGCVQSLLAVLQGCQRCLKSLVCCVTDSCDICECDCHHLLQFKAPPFSQTFDDHSWLFSEQCHFAFIGNPDCADCEGKNVYQSVNCSNSVYLHYHDYLIDGRWVVTEGLDDNDVNAVLRNRGDGLDDEECPEKEDFKWETRSKKSPAAGWFKDSTIQLQPFQTKEELSLKASRLVSMPATRLLLNSDQDN